ncbi:phage tail protein [Amphibacillus sp. MSJ-3]|uniref:phage tail protein n=1 Tax=Amphibacillus sp. MSJ-3 TaxID=2841505 RepID=UPI001C0F350C|nr:phage tail protein [Amphibacillus sp. MSJ-3]MBU5594920.1 phage tail protein [Amphibacillus sp. MSJ-3]
MLDRTLLIDDVEVSNHDLYYAALPSVPTPEQDVEHVEVRGRHGSLTKKYGFKDIAYPIEFYFHEDKPFKKSFRLAKPHLFEAKTLSFMDDDEVFYKVKSVQIETAENVVYRFGKFTVNFTLDPFQYELADSSQTITEETTLTNNGYESQPVITAHAEGTGKIYINDQEIGIKDVNGTIIIDSELMNAYRNAGGIITNLNSHMVGDFPVFKHGDNVIDFDGDITKLEINPRWRWV